MIRTCLALIVAASAAPAFALDGCATGQRVALPGGAIGTIMAEVSGMCLVEQESDRNVVMFNPSELTLSDTAPPPMDIRSITPGTYACNVMGTAGTVLTVDVMENGQYGVDGTTGAFVVDDPLSFHFDAGPLGGIYGSGQNKMLMFSDRAGQSLVCGK